MRFGRLVGYVFVLLLSASVSAQTTAPATVPATAPATQPKGPERFESTILAYEKQDKAAAPPAQPTLFIGSSTFTRWKAIPTEFKEFTAMNRAFGGSTLADLVYYVDRMIVAYKPKTIVLYAGTNDIAAGISPQQAAKDFSQLDSLIHAALPQTHIYFISAIPSPSRTKVAGRMDEFNALVQKHIAGHAYLHYIDARFVLSDAEKQPNPKLYVADRLHPNQDGYNLLIPLIREALKTPATTQAK